MTQEEWELLQSIKIELKELNTNLREVNKHGNMDKPRYCNL